MAEITQSYRISQLNTGKVGRDKFTDLLNKTITDITEDDLAGITVLGEYAFKDCSLIKNISLSDSIKTLNLTAFEGCNFSTFKFSKNIQLLCNKINLSVSDLVDYNFAKIPFIIKAPEFRNYDNCTYSLIGGRYRSANNYIGDSADTLRYPLALLFENDLRWASWGSYPYYKYNFIPEGVKCLTLTSTISQENQEMHFPSTLEYLVLADEYGSSGVTTSSLFFPSEEVFFNLKCTDSYTYIQVLTPLSIDAGKVYINNVDTAEYTSVVLPDSEDNFPYIGLLSSFKNLQKLTFRASEYTSMSSYFISQIQRENTEYSNANLYMTPEYSIGYTAYVPTSLTELEITGGRIYSNTLEIDRAYQITKITISENIKYMSPYALRTFSESCIKKYNGTAASLKSKSGGILDYQFNGTIICSDGEYTQSEFNTL